MKSAKPTRQPWRTRRLRRQRGLASQRERGQAITEYLVVTFAVVVVLLLASGDGAAIDQLNASIQSFFRAYSFAISVSPQSP